MKGKPLAYLDKELCTIYAEWMAFVPVDDEKFKVLTKYIRKLDVADLFGNWIKKNCRRIDILLDADLGIFTLELIEATLHYKYEPKYEGFLAQR